MAKNTPMKRNLREKSHSIVLRSLNFITWVAATFCFVMGVSWSFNQPTQPAINVTPAKPEVSPHQPSQHQEISSHPVGGEPWLHSEGKYPVKVAVKSQIFSAPIKVANAAKPQKSAPTTSPIISPAISPENNTTPPPSHYPQIHGEDVTPLLEALPAPPSMEEVPPQVALEEPSTISFSIPAQFESKIVREVKLTQPEKVIALTFDDGPWPHNTVQILDILKQHNVKATFFWVGECLKAYPQLAKQVVAEGHAVGNHTWHHLYRKFSKSEAAKEIEDTAELIYKTTGVKTSLFRPPGGVMNNGVTDYAKQKKYAIVMWSEDPMDYRAVSSQQLVKNILAKARSGGILLLHDGGGNRHATIQALPELITKLKEQGYTFVTVPELLELKDQERLQEGAVETSDQMFDPWTLIENEGHTTR